MAKHALLGNRLRGLRQRRGVTQVEMAAGLGISPSYLNLIEHNRRALTRPLLLKLAEAYDVDTQAFSGTEEARLLAELSELFADPVLRGHEVGRQALGELVGNVPEVTSALFSLYRAYRNAREDVLGLTERLADNPYLSVACHRLLTLLTSIRSCSEILQDNIDLPVERRQHFVDILVQESENLTELANELFDFFAGHGLRELRGAGTPTEEVTDALHARANHFPELETAAETARGEIGLGPANAFEALAGRLASAHGVDVEIARGDGGGPELCHPELSHWDPRARCLVLSEILARSTINFQLARRLGGLACAPAIDALVADASLSSPAARAMYRNALENYFAGALLMPYRAFLEAARDLRHDIELLQRRFGVSFEQVCHRLTTLQRPGAEGVPFHFLRVDPAGNILKRFSRSGLPIPRYGGACPLWNVHTAFMNPGRIDTQLARLPDGSTYLFVARAITKPGIGHRAPKSHYSVAIGCEVSFARHMVYADGVGLERRDAAVPVGIHCRQCPRDDCLQRAFPSLLDPSAAPALNS